MTEDALPPEGMNLRLVMKDLEDRMIREAMRRTGGVKAEAARLLGINRTTLVEKCRRLGMLIHEPQPKKTVTRKVHRVDL